MSQELTIQGKEVQILDQVSSELFLVTHTLTGVKYWLKRVLHPNQARLHCLQKEIRLLKDLCPHPNILNLVAYQEDAALVSVLYEYCEGGTLNSKRPADPLQALYHLALGLKHMHTQAIPVIHGNLSPGQIYEDSGIYKIGGLEAAFQQYSNLADIDIPQVNVGAVTDEKWRAPELLQVTEGSVIDCKVDTWNLGMLLYFMLFGMSPFADRQSQREAKYHLPEAVSWKTQDLLRMMLQANPLQRADMAAILSKLDEHTPHCESSLSCRTSCFSKLFGSLRSRRSTASLVTKIYDLSDVFNREVNVDKLLEKAWQKPQKVAKFFVEMLKLKGLANPQIRMKACLMLFFYIQDCPLIVYVQSPGVLEVLNYIDGYCSVRPGHPLKNDVFRRMTAALSSVVKEKFFITRANQSLFNGRFVLSEEHQLNITQHDSKRLVELLLGYWGTIIKSHELLSQQTHLSILRRTSRKALIDEQSRLLNLIQFFTAQVHEVDASLANLYMKHYYRANKLFEVDNQALPTGLVPLQALPDILIDEPIMDSAAKIAACSSELSLCSEVRAHPEPEISLSQLDISDLNERTLQVRYKRWEIDMAQVQRIKAIGKGSSSEVWLGLYQKTYVAVKQLKLLDSVYLKEFTRELTLLIKFRHPNLVLLMGAQLSDPLCIVMEFCGGGDLFHLLHKTKDLALSWEQRLKILQDVARGMHFLHHKSYMHRDLKSLNLLLVAPVQLPSDAVNVKISDFGLSKACREGAVMTGNLGTCHWMAPEILAGNPYSFKADVYSFGIVMYEVLTREIPYRGLSHELIREKVQRHDERPALGAVPSACPQALTRLMQMCWRTDPDKRPNFSAIVDMLNSIQVPRFST